MKRLFIMLIIACSAITTTTALAQKKQVANTPKNVIKSFEFITDLYGQKDKQTYSITKNPNTGIIESKEVITHFICDKSDPYITMMGDDFHKDEPVSYQLHHIAKGNTENFNLKVVTNDSQKNNYLRIRTKQNQEMWFMCCKNPTNPQLRDAYAIVWEDINNDKVEGDIFMITSLRPDIYEEKIATSSKTFKIEGRIDDEIKDSLYNVYIADSYDELNSLADDDYVACIPVINKRFEYTVELDKPKAGRIRCIFPDGSLCSAWINLDMVPGETYHITVHNGYYDEDFDYERRVGRLSGKSLVVGHDNDDAPDYVIEDTVAIDGYVAEEPYDAATQASVPLANLTETQKMDLQQKALAIQEKMKLVEKLYNTIGKNLEKTIYTGGKPSNWGYTDTFFNQITEQNKQIDNQFEVFLKTASNYGMPNKELAEAISEGMINFLTKQNKGFNECYKKYGFLSKAATKCQKNVNKLTEKYMKELSKQMSKL